jgi:hypothetical protein
VLSLAMRGHSKILRATRKSGRNSKGTSPRHRHHRPPQRNRVRIKGDSRTDYAALRADGHSKPSIEDSKIVREHYLLRRHRRGSGYAATNAVKRLQSGAFRPRAGAARSTRASEADRRIYS